MVVVVVVVVDVMARQEQAADMAEVDTAYFER